MYEEKVNFGQPSGRRRFYVFVFLVINLTVEAITTGREGILLAVAPGTCKTYTAFQKVLRL